MTLRTGPRAVGLSAVAVLLVPLLWPAELAAGTSTSGPDGLPSLVRRAQRPAFPEWSPLREGPRSASSLRARAVGGGAPASGPGLPGVVRLASGGALGGAAGFFGLGLLGAWLADESAAPEDDLAAVGGFFLGGLTGEVLGVAAGVHLADGGRGSFWADLGASALGALAFVAGAGFVDVDGADAWALSGLAAAAQVAFTVRTELRTR